jgi:hypothetical protein
VALHLKATPKVFDADDEEERIDGEMEENDPHGDGPCGG